MQNTHRVCPVEKAGALDNSIRRFLHNPRKILAPYIKKGMSVLDFGCGPGVFTIEAARLLSGTGKVIGADLQEGMLDIVSQKIKGTEMEHRITLHKCQPDTMDLSEKVDFILAFYVIHETPDHDRLFEEFKSILKPGGRIFIVEPKLEVSKSGFDDMISSFRTIGFEVRESPKVFFSRAAVLENMGAK